jgi:hypothetical protein
MADSLPLSRLMPASAADIQLLLAQRLIGLNAGDVSPIEGKAGPKGPR